MGYRVSRQDLAKGTKIEAKEHPSLSDRNVRRVARDHLTREGPGYYAVEKVTEKIIESKTKQMGAKPHRKKRMPPPYNPMTDGLPRSARRPPF
jgi:hypothetical protein